MTNTLQRIANLSILNASLDKEKTLSRFATNSLLAKTSTVVVIKSLPLLNSTVSVKINKQALTQFC